MLPALLTLHTLLMQPISDPTHALQRWVARPQPAFTWSQKLNEFKLTSQTWQDAPWTHEVTLQLPGGKVAERGVAYLVITGDRVDSVDGPFGQRLANASHLPVYTLFSVPNQPLFDLREDDLIAYTFQQYLASPDQYWPLLLPMANSAVRAMDMIEQATKGHTTRFIVTGESKRGWTTWLVGALGDPRVIGIAPVAFDNLNFDAQLKNQFKSWGHASEMLGSYTDAGLIAQMESEPGTRLREIVDPFFVLGRVRVPVLSIRGSNDPYWAADAARFYWPKVRGPKGFLVLPNEGHDFMNDGDYISALAAFPNEIDRPKDLDLSAEMVDGDWFCRWSGSVASLRLWQADSPTKDFRQSRWSTVLREEPQPGDRSATLNVLSPRSGFRATFVQFVGPQGDLTGTIEITAAKP